MSASVLEFKRTHVDGSAWQPRVNVDEPQIVVEDVTLVPVFGTGDQVILARDKDIVGRSVPASAFATLPYTMISKPLISGATAGKGDANWSPDPPPPLARILANELPPSMARPSLPPPREMVVLAPKKAEP